MGTSPVITKCKGAKGRQWQSRGATSREGRLEIRHRLSEGSLAVLWPLVAGLRLGSLTATWPMAVWTPCQMDGLQLAGCRTCPAAHGPETGLWLYSQPHLLQDWAEGGGAEETRYNSTQKTFARLPRGPLGMPIPAAPHEPPTSSRGDHHAFLASQVVWNIIPDPRKVVGSIPHRAHT